jgi:putative ABC transport system permease protein
MIRNYFRLALRNLSKHKGFSFINIAGLTLGITTCLLIALFVWDEKQYDRFVPDGDRVYRIYNERSGPEGLSNIASVPPMFATQLKQDFPEVESTLRILMSQYKPLVEAGDKKIYEDDGIFAEPSFFEIFPFTLRHGSHIKILDEPNSIVISKQFSNRYFGDENPVGKTLLLDKQSYVVKGVLEDGLSKFHRKINFILPLAAAQIAPERMQKWTWQQFYTYVKLKKDADISALGSKFRSFIKEKIQPQMKESGSVYLPFFQPLYDIHLYSSGFKFDSATRGNIAYVKALKIIALFMLIIACFNFINLATARSLKRAKEVGVRKSIGASRQQLMLQFTGETIFLSLLSLVISVGLVAIFLPAINHFTDKSIPFATLGTPFFLFFSIGLALAVGILAGVYPAIVLAAFKPVKVLKTGSVGHTGGGRTRWVHYGLVLVQFALSVLLIISAIVIYRQVNYLHNKDLGFNKEQIMFFPMRGDNMFNNYETFKNELTQAPGISSASIGYGFPGDIFAGDNILVPRDGQRVEHPATHLMVDFDYVKTLNLQIIAGRDFSKAITTDKDEAFIINETAVRELGFGTPEKAIGQQLLWPPWGASRPDSMKVGKIIGVVKDFNYKSLYDKMEVALLHIFPQAYWKVAVKMKTAGIDHSIDYVKQVWNKFSPDYPIEYKFMDENFAVMYRAEDKLMSLISVFTGITIFIGCLGLFGLTAYAAERRKKEIGVRKVLGASVRGILLLLSKDFIILILSALLIASPLAWYFMNNWLQDFAYRIPVQWWMFGIAGLTALLIAMITISFQAIRAAIANPVTSLRTE